MKCKPAAPGKTYSLFLLGGVIVRATESEMEQYSRRICAKTNGPRMDYSSSMVLEDMKSRNFFY